MKKLFQILIIIFFYTTNFAQTVQETAQNFWKAVSENQNNQIIFNGEILIAYLLDNNFSIDSTTIDIHMYTALAYSETENYSKSIELRTKTVELISKIWDEKHIYSIACLHSLSIELNKVGEYDKALETAKRVQKIIFETSGSQNINYALCLINMACIIDNKGDLRKSVELNKQALEIITKIEGKYNLNYATCINNLALIYTKLGDFKLALENHIESKNIKLKLNLQNTVEFAIALNNISELYRFQGDFSLAEENNLEALKILKNTNGENSLLYAESLDNLSLTYSELDEYKKALDFSEKALIIKERLIGKNNNSYATTLNNIAGNYRSLNRLDEALSTFHEVLIIFEKSVGLEHPSYATVFNNIAHILNIQGDFTTALEYSLNACELKRKYFGDNNLEYAYALNELSLIYLNLGDITRASECNYKGLKIVESSIGKENPNYGLFVLNMAYLFTHIEYFEKAIEMNLKALEIFNKTLDKNHEKYILCLNNLSYCYSSIGETKKALEYILKALKLKEKKNETQDLIYATCLSNIGLLYSNIGDLNNSLKYNFQALNLFENLLGKFHPNYATSLNNISLSYYTIGNESKAYSYAKESYESFYEGYKKNIFGLNKSLLIESKEVVQIGFNRLVNFALSNGEVKNYLFEKWININGLIASYYAINILQESNRDTTDIKLINELSYLNKKKQLQIEGEVEDLSSTLKTNSEIEKLEREISRNSRKHIGLNRKFYCSDISKTLFNDEIFIEFIPFYKLNLDKNQWTDSTQYLVFISDSKDSLVDYVFIEDGTKIDQDLFDQYKKESTDSDNKTDLKSEKFYNYFWKPIADKIGDAKTIYVSLGGVYNNINLNTIYNPTTGKYLAEEKDIRIVNSARDFVLSKESEKKNYTTNTASLFGFPNFDGNTTVSADTSDLFVSTRDLNSFWLDSLTRGGMKVKPLPATKTEVENISSTLKSKGWQVNSFLADNASETNIKKQQSPRILHVATHGYFFQDIPMEKDNNRFLGMDRQQVVQDPMLRSGLLLTGANKTLKGETTTGENGLLSAAEASLLDLRETELVVLSACETGKGEVKNSEGVYGLRKAFSDAGAQNIIMSLWKVDDKVTQEFMSRFYEIWLNEKTNIRDAFNKTQLEIKAKYPQPYYWGAFILVGE